MGEVHNAERRLPTQNQLNTSRICDYYYYKKTFHVDCFYSVNLLCNWWLFTSCLWMLMPLSISDQGTDIYRYCTVSIYQILTNPSVSIL